MTTNVTLSKRSSESEIKAYFNAVLELSKSDNPFPINLDEVWPLVYSGRNKAVRALKASFIENEDYQPVAQNGQRSQDGKFTNEVQTVYHLSLSCLEYFIARKVRPVFEVYRQVFHKTAGCPTVPKKKRGPNLTTKVKASLIWVEGLSKFLNLNEPSKLALLKQVADPLGLPTPDYTASQGTLKSASELLRENGYAMNARVFNQKLIAKGFMEEKERDSSKGRKKRFKSLTTAGMEFGENQIHPSNPHETQPLYYEHKFNELVDLICKD